MVLEGFKLYIFLLGSTDLEHGISHLRTVVKICSLFHHTKERKDIATSEGS